MGPAVFSETFCRPMHLRPLFSWSGERCEVMKFPAFFLDIGTSKEVEKYQQPTIFTNRNWQKNTEKVKKSF